MGVTGQLVRVLFVATFFLRGRKLIVQQSMIGGVNMQLGKLLYVAAFLKATKMKNKVVKTCDAKH